jgi:hypothetical protein
MIDHVKEDYGLPLQIRVIVDDLLENDPDLKPNELLRIINKKRSKYVRIEKSYQHNYKMTQITYQHNVKKN